MAWLVEETCLYAWPALPKPVLSFAIEPKSSADIDKVSLGLHKLIEEDPTLGFTRNADTKEMVLSGTGQLHLDLALEKLQRKYGAAVDAASDGIETLSDQVRQQPLVALLVAAAIGWVIGRVGRTM